MKRLAAITPSSRPSSLGDGAGSAAPSSGGNPYEREDLRAVCGRTLRPGGLAVTREALDLCAFPAGAHLLDLGCGPGGTLELLTGLGFEAIGLERSPALAAEARVYGRVLEGDFHDLPLEDASLDGVFCECVLSLAADPDRVLAECARVLKPGGRLALSDLVRSEVNESSPGAVQGCLAGAVPVAELVARLERTDLTVTERRDHGRALKELAARLVWQHGSVDILRRMWAGEGGCARSGDDEPVAEPPFRGRDYGYILLIAEKPSPER